MDTLLYTTKQSLSSINLRTGAPALALPFETGTSLIAPIFLDSEHVLLIRADRYITVVNTKSSAVKQQSHCPEPVKSLALSRSKTYLFAGTTSGKLYIWHFPSGELISITDAHYKAISTIACNDDDSLLLTAGFDGSCHVWDMYTLLDASATNTTTSAGSSGLGNPLDNNTNNTDGNPGLLSGFKTMERPVPKLKYNAHSMPITAMHLTSAIGNGGKFFTSSLDRHVVQYSLDSTKVQNIWTLPSPIVSLTTNPLYTELYAGCSNGLIYIISLYGDDVHNNGSDAGPTTLSTTTFGSNNDPSSGLQVYTSLTAHTGSITSLHVNPQSTHLISTSSDGTVIIWSLAQRQPIQQHLTSSTTTPAPITAAVLCQDTATSLKIHDDLLRKKAFAPLSRELTTNRSLTRYSTPGGDMASLRSIAFLPQPTNTFQILTFDHLEGYQEDHLLALIDSESTQFVPTPTQQPTQTNSVPPTQVPDENYRADEIKHLEAEVKKWKGIATEMYKKQKK